MFAVGDKVRCIKDCPGYFTYNEVYEVLEVVVDPPQGYYRSLFSSERSVENGAWWADHNFELIGGPW